jgi:Flp pilus assembly protein TadG
MPSRLQDKRRLLPLHSGAHVALAESRRGAMMILISVMIFAFMVTVAFAVDIAYMHLVRSELRSATDASAKAASEALARTQDVAQAIARGKDIASRNFVANKSLTLVDGDFAFGKSEQDASGKFVFVPGGRPTNSVRVNARRTDGSPSGSVPLFFGRIFNISRFQPEEVATATYLQRDIVLVVDRSGSMLDFNKFVGLKDSVSIFNTTLSASPVEVRVGLASYSDRATEDAQLTINLAIIDEAMSRMTPTGFTNISGGIDAGGAIMSRGRSGDFVERTMIVLTDGIQNRGRPARLAAIDQAARGTTIHAITFGRDADRSAMQEIAQIGRGRYFHADNNSQLATVFREIALTLSSILTQ